MEDQKHTAEKHHGADKQSAYHGANQAARPVQGRANCIIRHGRVPDGTKVLGRTGVSHMWRDPCSAKWETKEWGTEVYL